MSDIAHELTHFVNDCEGGINDVYVSSKNDNLNIAIRRLQYFLRDTECNARCSAFGCYLKGESGKIKKLNQYEDLTHIDYITDILFYLKDFPNEVKKIAGKTLKQFEIDFKKYKIKIQKIYCLFSSEDSSEEKS